MIVEKRNFIPVVLFSAALLALIIYATRMPYSDYAAYYFGSKLLQAGLYRDAYETWLLNQYIYKLGYHNLFASFTPFPPFTAFLMAPFTCIPVETSKLVFNTISGLLFGIALWRALKHFGLPAWWLLLAPLLFFIPLRNNFFFGQAYLLLFALLSEGYLAFEKKQTVRCAALWGIAILFKIFPLLLFFFLLLRRQYRQLLFLALACTMLLGVSVLFTGTAAWQYYLVDLMPRLDNGELNHSFTISFQSAYMLLKNVFVYDQLLNPYPVLHSPLLFALLMLVFRACVLATCASITLSKKTDDFSAYACWITAGMLVSPNGSTYSLILWLFPLLSVLVSGISTNKKILITVVAFLLCNIPVHYFGAFPVLLRFPRLYLACFAFGMLLLSVAPFRMNYKILSGLLLLFALSACRKHLAQNPDGSTYVLLKEKHLLIYDYHIPNGELQYTYWSEQGPGENQTGIHIAGHDTSGLYISGRQIYHYGKRLTQSADNKLKPILVNGNTLLYLSDRNRGVGFYTLRKLEIH